MAEDISISDPEPIAWPDTVKFIRQLSHDLRNHLNAAELQVALITEITADAEVKSEMKRLREMLATTTAALQKLSSAVVPPRANPIDYDARELLRDLQTKFEADFGERAAKVRWTNDLGDAGPVLRLDPQLIQQALFELLENASRFGAESIEVNTLRQGDKVLVEVRERKSAPADFNPSKWGREPLRHLTHGHYTLGLNRVRMIAEANGGNFSAKVEGPGLFVSTIMLPVARAET